MRTLLVLCFLIFTVSQVACTGDRYSDATTPAEWEEITTILSNWGLGDENRGPAECALCKSIALELQSFIQANASVTYLDELAYQVCLRINHEGLTPVVVGILLFPFKLILIIQI